MHPVTLAIATVFGAASATLLAHLTIIGALHLTLFQICAPALVCAVVTFLADWLMYEGLPFFFGWAIFLIWNAAVILFMGAAGLVMFVASLLYWLIWKPIRFLFTGRASKAT